MKLTSVVFAALVALVPAAALAQPPGKQGMTPEQREQRMAAKLGKKFDRMVARMDANGDGMIGPGEAGDRFERLKKLDANGDGWVTRDEFVRGKLAMKKAKRAAWKDGKARKHGKHGKRHER